MRMYSIILLSWISVACFSQGKIMMVGGGSEDEGGWSDEPYAWAVDQSANKKVAVISYSDEDNFIPDYFISLGAAAAKNFKIDTREVADNQATYDELMQYDVFFFKGGDQSIYYLNYKNTKTHQATIDKYNAGGVITGTSAGMAILSQVVFTAEHDSVYPDNVLQDYNGSDITLRNDLFSFLPGKVADSHFTERGRIGRLLGFLARWKDDTGELLTGIGVDDRTALCFATPLSAKVFGTGSVTVCYAPSFTSNDGHKPASDSIFVLQALHHDVISFSPVPAITDFEQAPEVAEADPETETGNYEVLLSGSEGLGPNTGFIDALINDHGDPDDRIIVVTAPGKGKSFINRLNTFSVLTSVVETSAAFNSEDQWELRNMIRLAQKILFVENDDDRLFNFLEGGATGALLKSHVRRNGILSGFIGEDSRYAGKIFVTNHLSDIYAAYYGELEYREGLDLLQTSVIMSNTFDANSTDYYENTTASIPYAVVEYDVKYGIYLNRNSYLEFSQADDQNFFKARGNFPALFLINKNTLAKAAAQPVNQAGDKRQYAGFEGMQYTLLYGDAVLLAGDAVPSSDPPYVPELPVVAVSENQHESRMIFFPNPSKSGIFHLSTAPGFQRDLSVCVTDQSGRILLKTDLTFTKNYSLDLNALPPGFYIAVLDDGEKKVIGKLIRQE